MSAFSIDRATGKLTALNTVSTKGNGPCHLAVDHTGKTLLAANYDSGSTAAFPIHSDGSLGRGGIFYTTQGPRLSEAITIPFSLEYVSGLCGPQKKDSSFTRSPSPGGTRDADRRAQTPSPPGSQLAGWPGIFFGHSLPLRLTPSRTPAHSACSVAARVRLSSRSSRPRKH